MIVFANPRMHADIRALWRKTFGDSKAFLSHYFAHMHRDENMLVCLEGDDGVVAMLTMFPITLVAGTHTFPARYIYAVATAEPWRGLGIGTSMMEHALSYMQDRGEAAAILAPAHFSLFGFYEKMGFSTEFFVHEEVVKSADLPKANGDIFDLEAAQLYRLRNQAYQTSKLFARWDEPSLDYILQSTVQFGGFALRFVSGSRHGYAIAAMDDDLCIVKELGLFGMDKHMALSLLHRRVQAQRYLLHQSADGDADPMPFTMIHYVDDTAKAAIPAKGGAPYFALAMD